MREEFSFHLIYVIKVSPVKSLQYRRICMELDLDFEHEETKKLRRYGEIIFMITGPSIITRYGNACGLHNCDEIFEEGETKIFPCVLWNGTEFEIRTKLICFSHRFDFD